MKWLLLFVAVVASGATENEDNADLEFNNDRQFIEEETGGILQLQSHGRLTKIVDLDEAPCIKVRNLILIVFNIQLENVSSCFKLF